LPPSPSRFHQDLSSFGLKAHPSGWRSETRRRHSGILTRGRGACNATWRCSTLQDPSAGQAFGAGRWPAAVIGKLLSLMLDNRCRVSGPIRPARALVARHRRTGRCQHANKIWSWGAGGSALAGERKRMFSQTLEVAQQNTRTGGFARRCPPDVSGGLGPWLCSRPKVGIGGRRIERWPPRLLRSRASAPTGQLSSRAKVRTNRCRSWARETFLSHSIWRPEAGARGQKAGAWSFTCRRQLRRKPWAADAIAGR